MRFKSIGSVAYLRRVILLLPFELGQLRLEPLEPFLKAFFALRALCTTASLGDLVLQLLNILFQLLKSRITSPAPAVNGEDELFTRGMSIQVTPN